MIEARNRDADCVSLDHARLAQALESEFGPPGLAALVRERNPHMFSELPVFVARRHVEHIEAVVRAVDAVSRLPGWIDHALAQAPAAAAHDPGNPGLFLGLDFHLEDGRISLIEVNTNPGGALLSAALGRAQRACCDAVRALVPSAESVDAFERDIVAMFEREWTAAGRSGRPRRIAIVDDAPREQYLYAEFLLFERLFARAGLEARIVDPTELRCAEGALWHGEDRIDLVYNRLTDFDFAAPAHAALALAWQQDAAVITPHPRQHALLADKRLLAVLADPRRLAELGADAPTCELLARHVPSTEVVRADNADRLWAERRDLFFKPWAGFGSRAAYRGAKLTRGVWEDIVAGRYVAQRLAPPGQRHVGADARALKFDLRAFADQGRVLWFSARLYQGQTTNFRTPGGGFAPVYCEPEAG